MASTLVLACALGAFYMTGCSQTDSRSGAESFQAAGSEGSFSAQSISGPSVSDNALAASSGSTVSSAASDDFLPAPSSAAGAAFASSDSASDAEALRKKLGIVEDFRPGFEHGDKPCEDPKCQKYIVLHDTEGEGSPENIVDYWDGSESGIAAHFVIGKDGSVVQCVPLDKIAHHAGFGDTGHNEQFGVEDESRDDKKGAVPVGEWASDYGMNSYSIGIELVHVGGQGAYPQAQLNALDTLIAYIDSYCGRECDIIDHKTWRSGNSDTSEEFAEYLANYQKNRTHKAGR